MTGKEPSSKNELRVSTGFVPCSQPPCRFCLYRTVLSCVTTRFRPELAPGDTAEEGAQSVACAPWPPYHWALCSSFVQAGLEIPFRVSIHYCSHSLLYHCWALLLCILLRGRKGFFPGCVLQHSDKGHTKCNTRNRKYWACKSNASWQYQHKCFHCKYKFCCLVFAYFMLTQRMLESFAMQHCRSRGWNTSVSIGTSALALLKIFLLKMWRFIITWMMPNGDAHLHE